MYIRLYDNNSSKQEIAHMIQEYLEELHSICSKVETMSIPTIIQSYFSQKDTKIFLLFDENFDDRLAGFAIIGTKSNCHPSCDIYIEEFYIDPFYRRNGHGTKLITSVLDLIDAKKVHFYIVENNSRAVNFWNRYFSKWEDVSYLIKDINRVPKHLLWRVYESISDN